MIAFLTAYEMCCGTKSFDKVQMLEFIQHAPARELQEFVLLGRDDFGVSGAFNRVWLEQAKISLQVRIGENATASAKKIIQQVMQQTDALVAESRHLTVLTQKLNIQTDLLIKESKKLGGLTWALVFLTTVLLLLTAGLLWIDWHRDKPAPISLNPPQMVIKDNFGAANAEK